VCVCVVCVCVYACLRVCVVCVCMYVCVGAHVRVGLSEHILATLGTSSGLEQHRHSVYVCVYVCVCDGQVSLDIS